VWQKNDKSKTWQIILTEINCRELLCGNKKRGIYLFIFMSHFLLVCFAL